MKSPLNARLLAVGCASLLTSLNCAAAPVFWTDWTSGTAGPNGSAVGVINTGNGTIDVTYSGEIQFIQTGAENNNYWVPSGPYISALVDNAPSTVDIIALSRTTTKTLTFSKPVDNLFLAVVSLNGNGWNFDEDFEVVSFGTGYWGGGTLTKVDLGNGVYQTTGTGEPHGVIRFSRAVSSISWTSQANENWNGFTVGTYGVANPPTPGVPDAGSTAVILGGALLTLARFRQSSKGR